MSENQYAVPPDVASFLTAYVAAYASGSVEQLERFYDEESLIWANQRPTVRAWNEVRAMFQPSFDAFQIDATVHLQEVRDGLAERFLRFLTEVRLTPRAGGAPRHAAFRDFAIIRRGARGWTIHRNMDQPITEEQLEADLRRDPPLTVFSTR